MTDPKLVERATNLFERLDRIAPFPGIMIPIITKALQAHGEEVRRKTVEECMAIAQNTWANHTNGRNSQEYDRGFNAAGQKTQEAIRKLLEVKGA